MESTAEIRARDDAPSTAAVPEASRRGSLVWLTARGFAWNIFGAGISQGLALAATVIIARWLTPVDYAIGGLALAAAGLFQVLTTSGFSGALVRLRELTPLTCHTVFWPVAATGALLAVVVVAGSSLLAGFYARPEIVRVLPILAVGLFASALGAVPHALLQRAMRFRAIGAIRVVATVFSAGLGITLAIRGHGYLALAIPAATASVIGAVAAFVLAPYRPRLAFSRDEFLRVRTFGLSQVGSSALQFCSENADYLILGRFWPATRFGHYYFSFERARQPFDLIYRQLVDVLFPALSRVQDQKEKLRQAYLVGTEKFCLLVFPLHVLLIGLADLVLPWLFGGQWVAAVPVFQIFALWAFVRGFAVVAPATYLALDRAQCNLAFNAFRLAVILPSLLVLGFLGADMVTTATVLLGIWIVQLPFYLIGLFRLINLRLTELWRTLRVVLRATLAMAVVLLVVRLISSVCGWGAPGEAAVTCVCACITYLVVARRRLRATAVELWSILGPA